ncbi:NAD(P)H-dependent oxidoreductase [Hafnia alvei]|uniref:NAD(P)H-dependent oxidoreductase n=1 Tax=Hafnia alvei TaxID=569 RepID=UPI0024A972C3|nr:NAD(P)H-dependent oxidoreductase [Hafnia alvei]
MKKVLVLAAHRFPDQSRISHAAIDALKTQKNVTVNELMRHYPDYNIDVEREQKLLTEHDIVVMLFPFYWYSSPAILKEWQDAVLTYGFAYGSQGKALHGKSLMIATSTGGNAQAYTAEGYNRYPVESLLLPFNNMSHLVGMHWLDPYLIQGANDITDQLIDTGMNGLLSRIHELQNAD